MTTNDNGPPRVWELGTWRQMLEPRNPDYVPVVQHSAPPPERAKAEPRNIPDLFLNLAEHILAMETDAYLRGHPEWLELCREAHEASEALGEASA